MQGEIFGLLLNDRGQGHLENAVKTHLCAMLGKFSASQHGACHARNVVRSHLCSQQAVIAANACFGRNLSRLYKRKKSFGFFLLCTRSLGLKETYVFFLIVSVEIFTLHAPLQDLKTFAKVTDSPIIAIHRKLKNAEAV